VKGESVEDALQRQWRAALGVLQGRGGRVSLSLAAHTITLDSDGATMTLSCSGCDASVGPHPVAAEEAWIAAIAAHAHVPQ